MQNVLSIIHFSLQCLLFFNRHRILPAPRSEYSYSKSWFCLQDIKDITVIIFFTSIYCIYTLYILIFCVFSSHVTGNGKTKFYWKKGLTTTTITQGFCVALNPKMWFNQRCNFNFAALNWQTSNTDKHPLGYKNTNKKPF